MSKEWKNFKCWCEGWNDAASTDTYEAYDPEMAAAMYAQDVHNQQNEYPEETKIHVIDSDGVETKWNVTWEARRDYSAEQL